MALKQEKTHKKIGVGALLAYSGADPFASADTLFIKNVNFFKIRSIFLLTLLNKCGIIMVHRHIKGDGSRARRE